MDRGVSGSRTGLHGRPLMVRCLVAGTTLSALLVLVAVGYVMARESGPRETVQPASHAETHVPAAEHEPNAIDHVTDSTEWDLFPSLKGIRLDKWVLPEIFGLQLTKFMILELLAAGLILLLYVPLARRMQSGEPPRGMLANLLEMVLTFVRDQIARPNIGEHDADRYVPFLWTLFLFILVNNLFGLIPLGGSPTASPSVVIALALWAFFFIHGAGVRTQGLGHYLKAQWPDIDVPFPMDYIIKPVVCFIEITGILVRNAVLAVRLFANMFAGHMVLATILIFIYAASTQAAGLFWTVTVSSVVGMVVLDLLELFIACLQAFIFAFLTSLFMGMAMHPQH